MGLVQQIQVIVFPENLNHNKAEEKKKKKQMMSKILNSTIFFLWFILNFASLIKINRCIFDRKNWQQTITERFAYLVFVFQAITRYKTVSLNFFHLMCYYRNQLAALPQKSSSKSKKKFVFQTEYDTLHDKLWVIFGKNFS
jgi:uncharacterized membrane protein